MRSLLAGVLSIVCMTAASDAAGWICNCGEVQCCPQLGEFVLTFDRRFTGAYRNGEPYDVVTAVPDGSGETLRQVGITLRVQLVCSCPGVGPIAGIPRDEIVLFNSALCFCPNWIRPDHDTDADGWTEFSGAFPVGGCAQSLTMFVDGVAIHTFPINVNSPSAGMDPSCNVDSSDLAELSTRLGASENYSICLDLNEDGVIDAGDVAYFAQALGDQCQ